MPFLEIFTNPDFGPVTLNPGQVLGADSNGRPTAITPGGANVGTETLDFGAFPGTSDANVAVTGQSGIVAGSRVAAWLFPATTPDHSPDEHLVETVRVFAGNIVAGTGFSIYGVNDSQLAEPGRGGLGTRIYGKWNIGWQWI